VSLLAGAVLVVVMMLSCMRVGPGQSRAS